MSLSVLLIVVFSCLVTSAGSVAADIQNPLAHWGLDGDGRDTVGANDLEMEGGDFEAGKYGQALSLDGSGAHLIDDNGGDYINGLDAITVAMWVKSNEVNTDKGFFVCAEPDGNDRYLCIRYDAGGSNGGGTNVIKTGVNTDQGKTTLESSNDIQTTDWQHVAIVWSSGEQLKLYIGGVQDEPTDNETAVGGALFGLTKVILGKGAKDTGGGGWDGLIDDVYIYPEALSAEEIVQVMESRALSVNIRGKLATAWGKIRK